MLFITNVTFGPCAERLKDTPTRQGALMAHRHLPKILAGAAMLSASAAVVASIAQAQPGNTWDVAAYDACLARGTGAHVCCAQSGGMWTPSWHTPPDTCAASSAAPINSEVPVTATFQPDQPPGMQVPGTPTFVPTG